MLLLKTITLKGFPELGDSAGSRECSYVFIVTHANVFSPYHTYYALFSRNSTNGLKQGGVEVGYYIGTDD